MAERLGQLLSDFSRWRTVRVGPKQLLRCGRDGQALVIIKLPTLRDEAFSIAAHLANALAQCKSPHRVRKRSGDYNPGADAIKVMTTKISKGLEFPVVALPRVGHMPARGEDETEAARVFYVAATRATQKLLVTVGGDSGFGAMLGT
ncbi:ATP-dependent exoDNAse (exonuclease V) beta subunit [Polaromonas sp. CG_9.5]|uniref:3'-5' exonuclease n=1 Tax=Polaromonas sp. CG_9.5 TaxID=3071705 RepID=UPI002E023706|nr:ATP-dependent exoDNAse (exonuclease V) beta subunit [Polaromonas sp. CG_9.5]